jgi:hypothetical protein
MNPPHSLFFKLPSYEFRSTTSAIHASAKMLLQIIYKNLMPTLKFWTVVAAKSYTISPAVIGPTSSMIAARLSMTPFAESLFN